MMAHRKLGEILVDLGVLAPRDVERVLEALRCRAGRPKFGQVARHMALVEEEQLLAALAVQMDLFPGIADLTLAEVLDHLLRPTA